jgi:DNA gyrase subunit A
VPDNEDNSNNSNGSSDINNDSTEANQNNNADTTENVVIEPIEIQEEMERSFLEYSMSVIVSRALPDARDGLKPVHRRILFDMYDLGIMPDRPYVKCSRVVGDVMGRFHPHGDSAIYEALARMVQDFSLRHPLIDGHGSFGSTSPEDGPAAMRYTECRLHSIALNMLEGIDEDTVEVISNYDGSETEPEVLPGRFPNLLVNGSQGIAVGMATNIPPHNLGEVIDATLHLIDNPEATPDDLMKFVLAPDFPTGALILGRAGAIDAYRTGRGSIKMRAVAEIHETKTSHQIVVSEFPYQTSPEVVEKRIAELIKAEELDGISGMQNDSAGRKPKLIIDLKRDANPNVVLNNLYKLTPLQTSFGANMLALVDGVPKVLNLREMLLAYVDHQIVVVTRRSQFRLKKASARLHIVEGLLKAIDLLDEVIALIRASEDRSAARLGLCAEPFMFSEEQANHILDMTLGRLTRLGRSELSEEAEKLKNTIAELESILGDPKLLRQVISKELNAVKEKFAQERRSKIVLDSGEMSIEDLIKDQEVVVTLTQAGYIKAVDANSFKTQNRGGRGVQGTKLKQEDLVSQLLHTTTHSYLLCFSNKGKVYRLRAHEIPIKERQARGTPIINLLPVESDETIQAIVDTRDFSTYPYLLFATKLGQIKKTAFSEYDKSRREGFIAISLKENDELVKVIPTTGNSDIFCVSSSGMVIRFDESDVRPIGRSGSGVRGMKLKANDYVVSCDRADESMDLLLLTDLGFGKRTKLDKFSKQTRGGLGVKGIKLTATRGKVVAAFMAGINHELLMISSGGITIKLQVKNITAQGRVATGVKVMNLEDDQTVAAAELVEHTNQE